METQIPKIIHQIWLGHTPIPDKFKKFRQEIMERHPSIPKLNPGIPGFLWRNPAEPYLAARFKTSFIYEPVFYHYLWTEENISEFNADHLLEKCDSVTTKSDVIRLLAIEKYGGVYLDMDIECVKSIRPLLNVPAFISRERDNVCCSAVFGAKKNHPWLKNIIKSLPDVVEKKGSWIIGLMTESALHIDSGVTIYPRDFFYPFLYDTENKDDDLSNYSENTYLVHHWSKSWWKKYVRHVAGIPCEVDRGQLCKKCGEFLRTLSADEFFTPGSNVFTIDTDPKGIMAVLPSGYDFIECETK